MNSLEVQEVQKEVSLLKSAVKVLHDEARALKKKLKVIVNVKCRCTLTHNAHVSEYCTHTPTHTPTHTHNSWTYFYCQQNEFG